MMKMKKVVVKVYNWKNKIPPPEKNDTKTLREPKPKKDKFTDEKHITYKWNDNEVLALIKAVEKRPHVWQSSRSSRRDAGKRSSWEEIISELGIPKLTARQAHLKWIVLRKKCVERLKNNTNMKFKNAMLFLPEAKIYSTKAKSMTAGSRQSTRPKSAASATQCVDSTSDSSNRQCVQSSQLSSSVVVQDANIAFCQYVLGELSTLTEVEARNLRRKLIQTTYDFSVYYLNM